MIKVKAKCYGCSKKRPCILKFKEKEDHTKWIEDNLKKCPFGFLEAYWEIELDKV